MIVLWKYYGSFSSFLQHLWFTKFKVYMVSMIPDLMLNGKLVCSYASAELDFIT